uniref:Uncharacterized protein n=1 Tax=Avena sativa TaxID=4498 RepID=A0ACD5WK08_AVESA
MGPAQVHRSLVLLIVLLLFCRDVASRGEMNTWCVASLRAPESALQEGLNYACGQGGVDCSAIQPGGSCFEPDTLRDHASYAFNSYFQKDTGGTARCDFGGAAMFTYTDPSTATCKYPSTR